MRVPSGALNSGSASEHVANTWVSAFADRRAQFLKDGRVLAAQRSVLPSPMKSGAIPMPIRAIAAPGDYEVRITMEQGLGSVQQSLKYTIASK